MSTSPCTVHGMSIDPIPQHPMGSHMHHVTLGEAPHWSMDIPWDPTCTMGHWDRHLTGPWDPTCTMGHWDRHLTGPWTSHGIPHVPWDTGTGTSLVHGIPHVPWDTGTGTLLVHGHPMGSHMYHGTLGQAPHWSMDIPWDPTRETLGQAPHWSMGHWYGMNA